MHSSGERETVTVKNYLFQNRFKSVLSRLSGAGAPSMIRRVSEGLWQLGQATAGGICGRVCVWIGGSAWAGLSPSLTHQKYSDSNTAYCTTHCWVVLDVPELLIEFKHEANHATYNLMQQEEKIGFNQLSRIVRIKSALARPVQLRQHSWIRHLKFLTRNRGELRVSVYIHPEKSVPV